MQQTNRRTKGIGRTIALWTIVACLLGTGLALVFLPAPVSGQPSISNASPAESGIAPARGSSPSGLGAVIANIPVGLAPKHIAFDSSNGKLFVSNEGGNSVTSPGNLTVIDGATNTVSAWISLPTTPQVALPMDLAFDSANGYVYVADQGNMWIEVINGATNANVTDVPMCNTCSSPGGLAFDSTSGKLFVISYDWFNDSVLSTSTNTMSGTFWPTPSDATGLNDTPQFQCYDPRNGDLYVTEQNASGPGIPSDIVIDSASTYTQVATNITTASNNGECAYDSTNGDIYVAGTSANAVYVISGSTNTLLRTISLGSTVSPEAIAYDLFSGPFYVLHSAPENCAIG